ncbi:MAG: hypothetical protein ACREFQ_00010, partial [Stellaceae bacterium]
MLGSDAFGAPTGNITVMVTSDVTLRADREGGGGFAQIGNGGAGSILDNSGNIFVSAGGTIALSAGSANAYAQIGNGGSTLNVNSFGTSTGSDMGDISIIAASIVLSGGSASFSSGAYAQIGNGGAYLNYGAGGGTPLGALTLSGNISIQANAVTLQGGGGSAAYAQIGNGGFEADANTTTSGGITIDGNIAITPYNASGTVSLAGGSGQFAYAQIGNGGAQSLDNSIAPGAFATTGSISIDTNAGGTIALSGGSNGGAGGAYAQVGQGGYRTADGASAGGGISIGGDIGVSMSGPGSSLSLYGPDHFDYAMIGNGDATRVLDPVTGTVTIGDPATTTLTSSSDGSAWLGNEMSTVANSGDLDLLTDTLTETTGIYPPLEASINNVLATSNVSVAVDAGSLTISAPLSSTGSLPTGNLSLFASGALSTPQDVIHQGDFGLFVQPGIATGGDVKLIGGTVTLNGTVSGADVVVGGAGNT